MNIAKIITTLFAATVILTCCNHHANPDSANIEKLMNPQHVVQMVVLDKRDTANRAFRFPTAIGKLNFKQVPW